MHYYPLYAPFPPEVLLALMPALMIVMLWTIVLKGYALWNAARNSQSAWFIALLVINTLGILEIVYLVWFRPTSISDKPAVSSSTQG